MSADEVPAALSETPPQGGLAGGGERVGADTHDPAASVGTGLAVLIEEVHAAAGPAFDAGAVG